jgi:hypothetical protein
VRVSPRPTPHGRTPPPRAARRAPRSDPSETLTRSSLFLSTLAAASDAAGLSGALLLPQSFGAIHLGETFVSYVSVANFSSRTATAVGIKAELQTDKTRAVLFDNTAAPLARLAPGERHDVLVEADLKAAGAHTLVCSTVYTDADGERKYLPQVRARAVITLISAQRCVVAGLT